MKYLRLYTDENGESHVEEMEATFDAQVYAPPAPAFGVSPPTDVARYLFVNFPANWTSDFHPTPRRQLFVLLSGRLEGEASDGTIIDLNPGNVLMMEDTSGKGHSAKTMDGREVHAMIVHLD